MTKLYSNKGNSPVLRSSPPFLSVVEKATIAPGSSEP